MIGHFRLSFLESRRFPGKMTGRQLRSPSACRRARRRDRGRIGRSPSARWRRKWDKPDNIGYSSDTPRARTPPRASENHIRPWHSHSPLPRRACASPRPLPAPRPRRASPPRHPPVPSIRLRVDSPRALDPPWRRRHVRRRRRSPQAHRTSLRRREPHGEGGGRVHGRPPRRRSRSDLRLPRPPPRQGRDRRRDGRPRARHEGPRRSRLAGDDVLDIVGTGATTPAPTSPPDPASSPRRGQGGQAREPILPSSAWPTPSRRSASPSTWASRASPSASRRSARVLFAPRYHPP